MKIEDPRLSANLSNREAAEMLRARGFIDADIARTLGLSRERIRQYQLPPNAWIRVTTVAIRLKLDHARVKLWRDTGLLRNVLPSGMVRLEEVEAVYKSLTSRACQYPPSCDQIIGSLDPRVRFCPEHREEVQRYKYPVLTADQRRAHNERGKSWKRKNPAKASLIGKRSRTTYRLVHRSGMPREEARKLALASHPD